MFRAGLYGKKGIAAILLGLFLFILAEKSAHDHSVLPEKECSGEARLTSVAACSVCDFQLHAGADLPVPVQTASTFYPLTPDYFHTSVSYFPRPAAVHPERGPPSLLA